MKQKERKKNRKEKKKKGKPGHSTSAWFSESKNRYKQDCFSSVTASQSTFQP